MVVATQETTKTRPVPVTVRCPACGAEALVTPAVGEIVAVYHLCPRPEGERRPPALTRMEISPAPPAQTPP
jgi:hypothetical protein